VLRPACANWPTQGNSFATNRRTDKIGINADLDLDLQNFRETLGSLQKQVDELDELKIAHYQEIVDHEEQVWDEVQSKARLISRASLACVLNEGFLRLGLSGCKVDHGCV
jgi:hypothetical protein